MVQQAHQAVNQQVVVQVDLVVVAVALTQTAFKVVKVAFLVAVLAQMTVPEAAADTAHCV